MKNQFLLLMIIINISVVSGCVNYERDKIDKTLLSSDQLIELVESFKYPSSKDIIFKNPNGIIVDNDSVSKLYQLGDYWFDFYADSSGRIVEAFIKKASSDDLLTRQRIEEIMQKGPNTYFELIRCDSIKSILDELYHSDQSMRMAQNIDAKKDFSNLNKVVNIIEQCGMPTLKTVDSKHIDAIWLVLQHSYLRYMKEYFHYIRTAGKNGDISMSKVAMMKDRILLGEGKKQLYGTQVMSLADGVWELSPLENPETVNKRRSKMGLGPIQEYLKTWSIDFDIVQKK
ncbi:DUF6624 domain-containing protein [Roseivirga pacifica]|uniref:DUF6624 domain-containing protein n=1 Tax=Roseivirga pacifica TaxID=1267423 RepID=UPI00227B3A78|nr:DUF6624 domain-containing protein [Roseivirga pacifica]